MGLHNNLVQYQPSCAPTFQGTHNEKMRQFKNWLDTEYPADIAMTRRDAQTWIESPFGHRGAFIATIAASVDPRMVKKHRETKEPNPYLGARKLSYFQAMGGNWSYKNAVNNARIKLWMENDGPIWDEDQNVPPMIGAAVQDFEPEPRKWGIRIAGSPWVLHKDRRYIELRVLRTIRHQFVDAEDNSLDEELIRPYLPAQSSNAIHQGVTQEMEIILRDYEWDNIRGVTYAGKNIIIID